MAPCGQRDWARWAGLFGAAAYGFQVLVQIPFVRALFSRRIDLGDGTVVEDASFAGLIVIALLGMAFVCLRRQGAAAVRRLAVFGLAASVLVAVQTVGMWFARAAVLLQPGPGRLGALLVCQAAVAVLYAVAHWELSERVPAAFRPLAVCALAVLPVQYAVMVLCMLGTGLAVWLDFAGLVNLLFMLSLLLTVADNALWAFVFAGLYLEGLAPDPAQPAWPLRRKIAIATLVLVPLILLGSIRSGAQAVILPEESENADASAVGRK